MTRFFRFSHGMRRFVRPLPRLTLLVMGMGIWISPLWSAPNYTDAKPLSEKVRGAVAPVAGGRVVQVPIITWGGDMATIHANGDARVTAPGSIFDKLGLKLKLVREDVFSKQLASYLSGKSPYLRGTMGMINMAAEAASRDPRTKPVVIYQLTWSAGGDAMVVKSGIRKPRDLKGKTIALQAYGPHVDYLTKVLSDAGLSVSDVKLKWLPDLTGSDHTPMAAFYQKNIDAAMVIIPDAMALTSGGSVGTGSEDSVKGARILMSTKTASRIIADVYAVRSDYFKANKAEVKKFVHGLMKGQEALKKLVRSKSSRGGDYRKMISRSAEYLLDSAQAVGDAEGLYADAYFVGYSGNVTFFTNRSHPRNMNKLNSEIQKAFTSLGLIREKIKLGTAGWRYPDFKKDLTQVAEESKPRFDRKQVADVVNKRQKSGTLSEGELFSFEVHFKPNQDSFSADLYKDAFKRVIELASTYGGAIITIEGHSDPMGYLRKKKQRSPEVVLRRVKQSAKNLSLSRSMAVRDSVIGFAKNSGISLDASQFAVVGHGISQPKNGMCGRDPCAPRNEKQWRENMRVEFRIIQVEAESDTFQPL